MHILFFFLSFFMLSKRVCWNLGERNLQPFINSADTYILYVCMQVQFVFSQTVHSHVNWPSFNKTNPYKNTNTWEFLLGFSGHNTASIIQTTAFILGSGCCSLEPEGLDRRLSYKYLAGEQHVVFRVSQPSHCNNFSLHNHLNWHSNCLHGQTPVHCESKVSSSINPPVQSCCANFLVRLRETPLKLVFLSRSYRL